MSTTKVTQGVIAPILATGSTTARTLQDRFADVVNVKDFGAVGDGVTDDTNAFQAAINYVANLSGGTVQFNDRHVIGNLYVLDYVRLQGPEGLADAYAPTNGGATEGLKRGSLLLNPLNTIRVNNGASVTHCQIINNTLSLPFLNITVATSVIASLASSATAGFAITINGHGASLYNVFILGFNTAIYSSGWDRLKCEYIQGDCYNGIYIQGAYDICYISNCHFWPWLTAYDSWTSVNLPLLTRGGNAYKYDNGGDWCKITNCFSYGYLNGFVVNACNNVQLIGCGADNIGLSPGWNSNGFIINGNSNATIMIGCQTAAQKTGLYINPNVNNFNECHVSNSSFWNNTVNAVTINAGTGIFTNCTFYNNNNVTPIVVVNNGATISLVSNYFESTNNAVVPIVLNGNSYLTSNISKNIFKGCTDNIGELYSNDNQWPSFKYTTANSNGAGYIINGAFSGGAIFSPIACGVSNAPITIKGTAYNSSGYSPIGQYRIQTTETCNATNSPGEHVFSITPHGSISMTDVLALSSDGTLLPLSDNAYRLGAGSFRWSSIWSATGIIQTSDYREKTNIIPTPLGLNFINTLNPVSYNFISGGNKVIRQGYNDPKTGEEIPEGEIIPETAIPGKIYTESLSGSRTHYGLIAQEVKAALPTSIDFGGWILTDKNNPDSSQGLRYEEFIAPMIKAIQELSMEINILKSQNDLLKTQILILSSK